MSPGGWSLRTNLPFSALCSSHAGPQRTTHSPSLQPLHYGDFQDPSPAAWGVPAHPLTPTSSEKCSLHLLTTSIHPESSSCRLFERGSPGARPLWTATPVDPCVFHRDWEPIDGQALYWRRTHKNNCWAEKNLVFIEAGLSQRHPHGWGSRLLVRTPKQGHFTHVLWNFSQYSVALSPNNIHVSALH